MISCKEASELSVKSAEKSLGLKGKIQLWFHTMQCQLCKAFDTQSRWIGKVASNLKSDEKFTEAEKIELKKVVGEKSNM
ncbi:MAG TPA: hypothetical protein DCX14_11415 [Flavobacteriales bacterium]|jgi:hypothetical protein|nr:hypothetical protein [Flavobacteriales bacterium]HAW20783.1 hypothetical protein [Flavobacteriales bacterium]